jgi:hypothetical protein
MQQPTELLEETPSAANSTKQLSVTPETSAESANASSESSLRKSNASVRMATEASSENLCKTPPVSEVQIESSDANVRSNEPTVPHPRNGKAPTHPVNPQAPSDDSCKKPPLSQRKIKANRQNSRAATGPKTLEGKRNYSRNAIKYGLFAAEVVNIVQGESPERFRRLLQDLWNEYEPVGRIEEILVEKIATSLWRQARILRAENGEASKALNAARRELNFKKIDQFSIDRMQWKLMRIAQALGKVDQTIPFVERGVAQEEIIRNLGRTRDGNDFLRISLTQIKEHVEKTKCLPDGLRTMLLDCLGAEWVYFLPNKTADGKIVDENALKVLSTLLDGQISRLGLLRGFIEETNRVEFEAEELRRSLPSDATDKLIRYETHLDCQLYRAMAELDRLQMRRRGESGPPEVRVHLTREG